MITAGFFISSLMAMPRLTTLKPRISEHRDTRVKTLSAVAVERTRGSRGVKDRDRIRYRDRGMCQACIQFGDVSLGHAVDHKQPLWAGGADDDDNKWMLCKPHHDAKSAVEASQRASSAWLPWEPEPLSR